MFLNVGKNPQAGMSGSVRQPSPVFLQNPCAGIPAKANRASTSPAQPIFCDCWVLPPLVTLTRAQNSSAAEQSLVFWSVVTAVSPQLSAPVNISFLSQLKH